MTFTIGELKALKDGTTPGLWAAVADYPYVSIVEAADEDGAATSIADIVSVKTEITPDHDLMAASPALLDALIVEKRAHAKLRAEVEGLRDALATEVKGPHYEGDYGDGRYSGLKQATAFLTRILEGNDG